MPNITNITPPRVPLTDPRTGMISREWYRFFLNLFVLTGSGQSDLTVEDLAVAPTGMTAEMFAQINDIYSAALSYPSTQDIQSAINSLRYEIETAPRSELGTLAAIQQDNVPWLRFNKYPSPTPSTADVGTVYWDGGTTMNVVMTPHVVQPVGEAQYYYIKCSQVGGVSRGQVIMFDGAVGASNQLKGKLATGLTSGDYLMGVAAEDIAYNDFGMVTSFGNIASLGSQKIDTSAWPLGTILYYDPATPGGLTSTLPSAPNVKATIAAVTESSTSGSIFVRVSFGSKLGETDSNVQFTALADKNIIQYDSALGYWKNVAPSAVVVGTATNLAGGAAGSVPYQTAPNTTTFLSIGSARSVLQTNAGATAPEWVNSPIFGSAATTDGVQLFSGYYTAGQIAVWGGEFSNGGPVTGYAVKPNTTTVGGFLSTTPNNLARTAYTLRNGSHSWYYAPAQAVAINGAITGVVEAMKLDSTGLSIATGYSYQINGTSVLNATTLGSGVVSSSLTSVGTIGTGVWNGTQIGATYGGTGQIIYAVGDTLYASSTTALSKLALGTARGVLQVNAGATAPSWVDSPIFGSASTTTGVQLFAGYYTAGQIAVWGGEFSNGGPVVGYAVKPDTSAAGAFLSTTTANVARSAYTLRGGTHLWFAGASQTVAIGSAVTTAQAMSLSSTALSLSTGLTYQINATNVLSATTLGSGVTASSLTSVGTLTSLTVTGNLDVSDNFAGERSVNVTNNNTGASSIASYKLAGQGNNFFLRNYGDGTTTPNRTDFLSTAGGSYFTFSPSSTEVLRLGQSGNAYVESGAFWQYAPAPTAKTSSVTLTAAELKTGIITSNGTSLTLTLPTGTSIDSGFPDVPTTDIGFDVYFMNLAATALTIAVNTNVTNGGIAGNLTVAASTSAHFRLRRSAANTYVLYRLT